MRLRLSSRLGTDRDAINQPGKLAAHEIPVLSRGDEPATSFSDSAPQLWGILHATHLVRDFARLVGDQVLNGVVIRVVRERPTKDQRVRAWRAKIARIAG